MGYPTRIYYSESERQKIFDRWLAGESQNAIACSFGRSHSSIQGVLARTGGIRPRKRQRSQYAFLRLASGRPNTNLGLRYSPGGSLSGRLVKAILCECKQI